MSERQRFDPDAEIWKRGIAVGYTDIKKDTMLFRFQGEKFEFPTLKVYPYVRHNGYFYEAKVDDLRKLEAESATEPPG